MSSASYPDQTEQFLQELPEIQPGQAFRFACHPNVPCFNACCSDLTLMLTPYDVLMLRRELRMPSQTFLQEHASTGSHPQTGFPLVFMTMLEDARKSCPFVRPEGCSVYNARPGACRAYPLGRASRIEDGQVKERYFLVQEEHCQGFNQDRHWTPSAWYADQQLLIYNDENDRYMALMARQRQTGRLLDRKRSAMALMALYQPDQFQQFIRSAGLLGKLDLSPERQAMILSDEYATIDFAYHWLEFLLYGSSEHLRPRSA
ncbi:YkgJ family cysteine cluster protein [Megalodesulfovibrio paquesii]